MQKPIYEGTKEILEKYKTREEVARAADEFFALSKQDMLERVKPMYEAEMFLFMSHRTISIRKFAELKKANEKIASCMAFMYNFMAKGLLNDIRPKIAGCFICPLRGYESELYHLMPDNSYGTCEPYWLDTRRPDTEEAFNMLNHDLFSDKKNVEGSLKVLEEYASHIKDLDIRACSGAQHTVAEKIDKCINKLNELNKES